MSERGYTIRRAFDAPREVVWEAWTTPAHFARWFGTEAMEMRGVEFDLRPGGLWHGTMVFPDGAEVHWTGVFVEVEAPSRLEMDITDGTGEAGEFERYSLTLADAGERTEMVLRQSGGHLSDDEYERAKAGTESFMDSLAGLLPDIIKMHHDTL